MSATTVDSHSNMTRYLQQILTEAVITIPLIPYVILGKYWIKQKYKLWSEMDQFSMQIDNQTLGSVGGGQQSSKSSLSCSTLHGYGDIISHP